MAREQQGARKPATKFPQLQKKMAQNQTAARQVGQSIFPAVQPLLGSVRKPKKKD